MTAKGKALGIPFKSFVDIFHLGLIDGGFSVDVYRLILDCGYSWNEYVTIYDGGFS